jgi:hypothetical protein
MPQNVSFFNPQNEQEALRRQRMATMLMENAKQKPTEVVGGMAVKQSPWVGLANALGGAYGASQQEQVDALRAKDAQERQKFLSDAVSQYGSDPKTLSQALISKPEFTAAGLSLLGDSIKGDQLTAYQAAMLGMQSQKFQAEYPPDPRTGQPKKPVKPTVRDEIEMSKARDASDKAIQTQNIISEAEPILQRYETSKATPVVGFMGQVANAIGIAGDETKQKVQDFESLNRISKELGIATLQQFGGNDSNEELKYLQRVVAGDQRLEPEAMKRILASAEKKIQNNIARLQKQAGGGQLPTGPMTPAATPAHGSRVGHQNKGDRSSRARKNIYAHPGTDPCRTGSPFQNPSTTRTRSQTWTRTRRPTSPLSEVARRFFPPSG